MEELASLGFISVIPAILAIVLSFATKNTIVALAIACITGTTLTGLAQGTNLLETLLLGFPTLLKENLGNTSFSWVMLLNTFIGILVAYFQRSLLAQGSKRPSRRCSARYLYRLRVCDPGWWPSAAHARRLPSR